MSYKRTERLNDQIRMEIADILTTKVRDPRVGFATVTSVDVAPDLRHARVFVTFLESGPESEGKHLEGIRKASPFIRGELGRRLRIRYIPELTFEIDRGIEAGDRVLKLLDDIRGD
jgi:ribosome-binding factor A